MGTLSILLTSAVLGQSTFQFQNLVPPVLDAAVFDAYGNPLAGANYAAELWGGAMSNSLSPTLNLDSGQRLILPFGEGLAAGYFGTTASMAVWEVPGNGLAWLQVRAWDTRLGATYEDVDSLGLGGYGESLLFQARGGCITCMPPVASQPLIGLQSFSLLPVIPEPSTWALFTLGAGAIWFAARRRR